MKNRLVTLLVVLAILSGCAYFERPTEKVLKRPIGDGVTVDLPADTPPKEGDVIVEQPTGELSDAEKLVTPVTKTGLLGRWGDLLGLVVILGSGYATTYAIEKREEKKKLLGEQKEVNNEIT